MKLLLVVAMIAGVLLFTSAALAQPSSDNGFTTLTKTAGPNPVTVGQPLTFTLTETADPNHGALGDSVMDTLPAGVRFVLATSDQGTCAFDPVANTVTCGPFNVSNPPSPGFPTTFMASIVVVPTTPGTITNTARDDITPLPGRSPNMVSVDVTVLPQQQPQPQPQPQQPQAQRQEQQQKQQRQEQQAPPRAAGAPEVTRAPVQTYVSGTNTINGGAVTGG